MPLSPVWRCLWFFKATPLPYFIPAGLQTSLILSPRPVLLTDVCSPSVVSDVSPHSISWFHGHFCADLFMWLVPTWSFPKTSSCLPSLQCYEIRVGRERASSPYWIQESLPDIVQWGNLLLLCLHIKMTECGLLSQFSFFLSVSPFMFFGQHRNLTPHLHMGAFWYSEMGFTDPLNL